MRTILAFVALCSLSLTNAATWLNAPSMPEPRSDFVVLAHAGIFYINAGCLSNQTTAGGCDEITNTFISYNTLTQQWSRLPSSPTNRTQYSAASVELGNDTLLYYMAGFDDDDQPSYTVDVYSVVNQEWQVLPIPMRVDDWRTNAAAFVIDRVIYVVGGYSADWAPLNTVLTLNTSSAQLAQQTFNLSSLTKPVASGDSGAVTINGKGYVFGGFSDTCAPLTSLEVYDPLTQQWSRKSGLLTGRGDAAYAAVGGLLFVMGGEGKVIPCDESAPSVPTDDVEFYNPANDKWTFLSDIPVSRFRFSGNVGGLNGQTIFNIGGQAGQVVNSTNPNSPSYYPSLSLVESLDVSDVVANPDNFNGAANAQPWMITISMVIIACVTLW